MKFSTIEELYGALSNLSSKEMPIKTSYKFSKILSSIEKDNEFFVSKMKEIIMKYAEKDEDGTPVQEKGSIKIQKEYIEITNKEVSELYDIEFETPDIKFTLDELDSISLTPADLKVLLPFIEE